MMLLVISHTVFDAINNIIINNKDKNIIIYLSERSKKFSFLINNKNITFKIVNL